MKYMKYLLEIKEISFARNRIIAITKNNITLFCSTKHEVF